MKGLLKSKVFLTLITLMLLAGAIAIPLSGSIFRTHAAGPSGMVALSNSIPPQLATARSLRHHTARAGEQLTIELLFAMNSRDQMNALMNALYDSKSPRYHHWLPKGQFDQLFGPTPDQVTAAKNFLRQAGLTLITANTSTFLLPAQGSLSKIEAAFHVSINDYRSSDGTSFFANNTNVQIPGGLSGTIQGVLGLNNITDAHHVTTRAGKASPNYGGGPNGSGLTPSQVAGIYNADPVYKKLHDKGQGVTLGLFEEGDYTQSDITVYEKQFKLPAVPIVNVPVLGGATQHFAAAEIELDIEAQLALAPKVDQILVYEGGFALENFAIEALQIAFENVADVVNVSYGVCEPSISTAIVLGEFVAYSQMALQGQSAFVSSGDNGAFDCAHNNASDLRLEVSDPASQPFVTAVGGTSFAGTFDPGKNPHPKYPGTKDEHVWNLGCSSSGCGGPNIPGIGASGGGVSRNWPRLPTQIGPGVNEPGFSQKGAYCHQLSFVPCREVPDVSIDGDPASGFATYCTDSGAFPTGICSGWFTLGGTSLSSPLWAAIATLVDSDNGGRVGLFTLAIYFASLVTHDVRFHDITIGNNGHYPAGPNYDMSTGLGTPDIYNLVNLGILL